MPSGTLKEEIRQAGRQKDTDQRRFKNAKK
jgi:hypothetical protein